MSEDFENVDQPDETPVTGRRLSRRTMIAGTAGAAAAMWAAPAVTSLAPRAFAQSPVSCQGVPYTCIPPIVQTLCGSALGGLCYCVDTGCYAQALSYPSSCTTDAQCVPIFGLPSHCIQPCGGSWCALTCADANNLSLGTFAPSSPGWAG